MRKLHFTVATCVLVLSFSVGTYQLASSDAPSPTSPLTGSPMQTTPPAVEQPSSAGPAAHMVGPVPGALYGTSGSNLYLIDKTTGAATLIGPHGNVSPGIGALTFDKDWTLYGLRVGDAGALYKIDVTTGQASAVGPLNIGFIFEGGLGFDASGKLIGVNQGDASTAKAFGVNTLTGAGTLIGPVLGASRDLNDLAFDGQIFYALDRVSNTFGTLDQGTGVYSPIGNPGSTIGSSGGLAVDPADGKIYATFSQTGGFYLVDRSTGHATAIGSNNPATFGLAFAPKAKYRVYLPLVLKQ